MLNQSITLVLAFSQLRCSAQKINCKIYQTTSVRKLVMLRDKYIIRIRITVLHKISEYQKNVGYGKCQRVERSDNLEQRT